SHRAATPAMGTSKPARCGCGGDSTCESGKPSAWSETAATPPDRIYISASSADQTSYPKASRLSSTATPCKAPSVRGPFLRASASSARGDTNTAHTPSSYPWPRSCRPSAHRADKPPTTNPTPQLQPTGGNDSPGTCSQARCSVTYELLFRPKASRLRP